jgi:DNA-binding NarL/FixJ family response regulator
MARDCGLPYILSGRFPLPKRILIADDHESVLRRVRAMLESQPTWEVCGEAVNGREAVAKAVQLKPDLVVVDFAMPQLDGLKTASEIHALLPEVPIVMFTMYAPQVKQEVQKYGISCLVDKSESGALVTAVQELLRTKESLPEQPSSGPVPFSSPALDRDSQKGERGPITKAS